MMGDILKLKLPSSYIEIEQCDLDLEEELRAAYAVNGPVVSIIAEFREHVIAAALRARASIEGKDNG